METKTALKFASPGDDRFFSPTVPRIQRTLLVLSRQKKERDPFTELRREFWQLIMTYDAPIFFGKSFPLDTPLFGKRLPLDAPLLTVH